MKTFKLANMVRTSLTLALACGFLAIGGPALAQSSAADAQWTGQVVCQLNLQSQGYTRQETQTWTITNGAPRTGPGAARLFPATWTVTGTGSVQKTQNGQTFTAQWNTNVPSTNGFISVFIRASDGRLIFRQGHSQMRNDFSLRGTRQSFWNGQQQQPAAVAHPTWEWQLPWMEADPSDANPSGTFSVTAEALPAELNNPPDLTRIAACNWHFSRGGASAGSANSSAQQGNAPGPTGPPAQGPASNTQGNSGCLRSAADIVQSFTSMKADVEQQFDRLIREATDPATAQSLQVQKQKTLADLNAQEQRDLQASGNCPPGSQGGGAQSGTTQTGGAGSSPSGAANNGMSNGNQGAGGSPQGAQTGISGSGGANNKTNTGTNTGSTGNPAGGSPGGANSNPSSMIPPDGNEPNDAPNIATNLGTMGPGTTQIVRANLHIAADRDYYLFSLLPGTQATVTLTANGPGTNFALNQYRSDFSLAGSTATGTGTTANFSAASGSAVTPVIFEVSANAWNSASPNYSITVSASAVSGTPNNSAPGSNSSGPTITLPGQTVKQISTAPALQPGAATKVTTPPLGKTIPGKSPGAGNPGTQAAPPASGNYLVTVNGLICTLAASSSDAIHVGAVIRQYDRRSGQNTMFTNADTWVYGDVNNMQGQRKQAGSRSQTGGIGIGDMIPTGFVPGVPNKLPAQANLFPLLLWQGTLTDGADVVAISPSVWINYGDQQLFSAWHQNEQSFNNSLLLDNGVQNQISSSTLGVLYLGSSTNSPGSTVQATTEHLVTDANTGDIIQGAALGGPLGLSTGLIVQAIMSAASHPGIDRPFGLVDANATTVILPNATLVLTREMIEKSLGNNSWAFVTINFKDTSRGFTGGDQPGAYTMFIEIDRK